MTRVYADMVADLFHYGHSTDDKDATMVNAGFSGNRSYLLVPTGTTLNTFIVSPELESVPDESQEITYDGPILMWVEIMQALGIPGELLAQNAKALLSVSIRESDMPPRSVA